MKKSNGKRFTLDDKTSLPNGEAILLSDEELAHIKEMQVQISSLKIALADAYMQATKNEDTMKAAIGNIDKLNADYIEEAKTIARSHGVDIDKPDQGQWNLDLTTKILSKVG